MNLFIKAEEEYSGEILINVNNIESIEFIYYENNMRIKMISGMTYKINKDDYYKITEQKSKSDYEIIGE